MLYLQVGAIFRASALTDLLSQELAWLGEDGVNMERRTSTRTLCAFVLTVVLLGGLGSSCSPGKGTATATPTLDAEAIKQAAVATLVARMSATTPTAEASPTSTAGDALKKLPTSAPTDTPVPTNTPEPTPTPAPSTSIDLTGMHYEAWGSPSNNACQQFDDSHPMRKFQLEITVYNSSRQKITDWYPEFYASNGRLVVTCFYGHGNVKGFPEVPAGENRTVTFAAFAENSEYIKRMKMIVLGQELRRCFNTSGALIGCP